MCGFASTVLHLEVLRKHFRTDAPFHDLNSRTDWMLPDYPAFKKNCSEIVRRAMEESRNESLLIFGPDLEVAHFEGSRFEFISEQSKGGPDRYQRVQSEFAYSVEELERLTFDDLIDRMIRVGREIGNQQANVGIQAMQEALEGTENEIVHSNSDFVTQILQAFEVIRIDFDKDGKPLMPQIMAPPNLVSHLEDAVEKISQSNELESRLRCILERKKEEWRDRQASRKLVG